MSTNAYTEWNVAISIALNEYRSTISIETINQAFTTACEHRSVATTSILIEFTFSLSPLTIEKALVACRRFSEVLCLTIIKRWAVLGRPSNLILLTPTSIVIGHTILVRRCTHADRDRAQRWRDDRPIRKLLDDHYAWTLGLKGDCQIERCGIDGNVDMVRAMLKEDSSLGGLYLRQGVKGNNLTVVMLVVKEFEHTRHTWNIESALETAASHKYPLMVDLLMDLLKDSNILA